MRCKSIAATAAALCLCAVLLPACSAAEGNENASNANANANATSNAALTNSSAGNSTINAGSNANTNKNSASEVPASLDVEKATADELLPYVADGAYRGTAEGFKDFITVRVVVKDHAMTNISVIEEHETEGMFEVAEPILNQMRDANSTDVDAITGATTTCDALKEAVTDALRGAVM